MWSKKQHEKFIAEIRGEIKTTVNGQIAAVDKKLSDYIDGDKQWKKDNQPSLDNMKDLTITGKSLLKFALVIVTFGGAWTVIKRFI